MPIILVKEIMILIVMSTISYLIGSIPSGVIIAKIFKLGDLSKLGSGNTGGTNVGRIGGSTLGILTVTSDIVKGMIAMSLMQKFGLTPMELALMGLVTVIGHVFPIWLKFRGGKGVATTAGVLISIDPYTAIVFCSTWVISLALMGIASLSSILAIVFALAWAYFTLPSSIFLVLSTIFVIVLLRHKDNIKRLRNNEEESLY